MHIYICAHTECENTIAKKMLWQRRKWETQRQSPGPGDITWRTEWKGCSSSRRDLPPHAQGMWGTSTLWTLLLTFSALGRQNDATSCTAALGAEGCNHFYRTPSITADSPKPRSAFACRRASINTCPVKEFILISVLVQRGYCLWKYFQMYFHIPTCFWPWRLHTL